MSILFIDIKTLIKNNFKNNNSFDITFNKKELNWIKNQSFEKIFIISNEENIEKGFICEQLYEMKFEYVKKILKFYIKKPIFCMYYPFKEDNRYLIQNILNNEKINLENCILLGRNKKDKEDAEYCKIKYINLRKI